MTELASVLEEVDFLMSYKEVTRRLKNPSCTRSIVHPIQNSGSVRFWGHVWRDEIRNTERLPCLNQTSKLSFSETKSISLKFEEFNFMVLVSICELTMVAIPNEIIVSLTREL